MLLQTFNFDLLGIKHRDWTYLISLKLKCPFKLTLQIISLYNPLALFLELLIKILRLLPRIQALVIRAGVFLLTFTGFFLLSSDILELLLDYRLTFPQDLLSIEDWFILLDGGHEGLKFEKLIDFLWVFQIFDPCLNEVRLQRNNNAKSII